MDLLLTLLAKTEDGILEIALVDTSLTLSSVSIKVFARPLEISAKTSVLLIRAFEASSTHLVRTCGEMSKVFFNQLIQVSLCV